MKVSQLKLSHGVIPDKHGPPDTSLYKVEQVTNSTSLVPGQLLTKREVDEYCSSKYWNVTIYAGRKD